jgi:energy-coupling factor transport system ATP-binding protein
MIPPQGTMDTAVVFDHLTFTYRGANRAALREISGEIDSGSFLAVMGAGGAGKSTLCCCLNALVPRFFHGAYTGRVVIGGGAVAERSVAAMSRRVGLVFQDFEAQIFSTDVEQEVAFGLENHCLPPALMAERIERYLAFAGLAQLKKRFTSGLSGGQKQRLAIAAVLAMEPPIVVMDEPTTDLDPRGREEILCMAERLRTEGRTMIMTDHEPETALRADEIVLLKEGRIAARGRPADVLKDLPLLASCGVTAPAILALFRALGWPGDPLTAEEALALIARHHLCPAGREPRAGVPLSHTGAPLIRAEGLGYMFAAQQVQALRGIDLSVDEGEFIALLGQNGSGKTTLARHMNGLLAPTEGRMFVAGKPAEAYRKRDMARLVGYVFQNPDHQIFARTVREEVGFGPTVLGETRREVERRVAEALTVVGLAGQEDAIPFVLAKGERQRVAVASVLASQPRVIILDEPTTGLDHHHREQIMEMLARLHRLGHTIIIITHALSLAAAYAERTVVMKDGRVLLDGSTRDVFAQERVLEEASLRIPDLITVSNRLGAVGLTVEQLARELRP